MSINVASRRALRSRYSPSLLSPSSASLPSRRYPDIWLAIAHEYSSVDAKVRSAPAPVTREVDSTALDTQTVLNQARLTGLRVQVALIRRKIERLEAFLGLPSPPPPHPRARPSQTGSHSGHRGSAVPVATRVPTPGSSADPRTIPKKGINGFIGGQSPKPVIKSILKPSTSTPIASEQVSACAGPIDLSGEYGICEASAEVYAASWRSFPAREWANDKLPIERLDQRALRRQRIERRRLLAGGAPPRRVKFEQDPVAGCRVVSRWIED